LKFLEQPLRPFNDADYGLLKCVTQLLELEHVNCNFNKVQDTLPKRQQRQPARFATNQRNSNQQYAAQPYQQQRRLPSPQANDYYQRAPANTQNKRYDSPQDVRSGNYFDYSQISIWSKLFLKSTDLDPFFDPVPDTSPSMQPNRIDELDRIQQDRSSIIPNDPAPTVQEPVFDPIPSKAAPKQQQQRRQEPRSKKLIEELNRAQQNRTSMQKREPEVRAEPAVSSRNRNEEMLSRRTQPSSNFYHQQDYNQPMRNEVREQNPYEKPNDQPFQHDRDFENRNSGRFNGYNERQVRPKDNVDSQRHRADLYVPPPRRNVDDTQRNRQQNDQPKRGNFRDDANRKQQNLLSN
jgi:hypothetical protein